MKVKLLKGVGTAYRLGLYDPLNDDDRRVKYIGPQYPDTPRGRRKIQRLISGFYARAAAEGITLCVGIYPVKG